MSINDRINRMRGQQGYDPSNEYLQPTIQNRSWYTKFYKISDEDTYNRIAAVVEATCDAVGSTMGIGGQNALISTLTGQPLPVKDGVTVAKYIRYEKGLERLVSRMLLEASKRTVQKVGDGTTCTYVLSQGFFKLIKHLHEGDFKKNRFRLSEILDKYIDKVIERIRAKSKSIWKDGEIDIKMLRNIAKISANNNTQLGNLIADTFAAIGKYGKLSAAPNNHTGKTYVKINKGYTIPATVIDPDFLDDKKKGQSVLHNPFVAITDNTWDDYDYVKKVFETWVKHPNHHENRNVDKDGLLPLVLFCNDAQGSVLSNVLANKNTGGLPIYLVKNAFFQENRLRVLEDIQKITGTFSIISSKRGNSIEFWGQKDDFFLANSMGTKEMRSWMEFGQAKKIILTKHSTSITALEDKEEVIEQHKATLIAQMENEEDIVRKEFLKDRVARLSSGQATIYVSSVTQSEFNYTWEVVDDAIRACEAALRSGYVIGAGRALLDASAHCKTFPVKSEDAKLVLDCIRHALSQPFLKIYENAGHNRNVLEKTILPRFINKQTKGNKIAHENGVAIESPLPATVSKYKRYIETEDGLYPVLSLAHRGVIDPTEVPIESIRNSVSIIKQFLTSNYFLIPQFYDE